MTKLEVWVAIDVAGREWIYNSKPYKDNICIGYWGSHGESIRLPRGTIKKLTGIELTWNDDPYKIE